jgi:hypothetical protein
MPVIKGCKVKGHYVTMHSTWYEKRIGIFHNDKRLSSQNAVLRKKINELDAAVEADSVVNCILVKKIKHFTGGQFLANAESENSTSVVFVGLVKLTC